MNFFRYSILAFIICSTPALVTAQGNENGIFQGAMALYTDAQEKSGANRHVGFRNVKFLLDLIVSEYPETDLAVRILLQDNINGLDVSALDAAISMSSVGQAPLVQTPDLEPFLGSWYDGGPYCAEISRVSTNELLKLRLWYCEAGIANGADASVELASDGLKGTTHQINVSIISDNEIHIDLVAPLFDVFHNQIGPNGPDFNNRFIRANPELPASSTLQEPTTETTEASLSLDRSDRREIQRRFKLLGFEPRGVDGVFGSGSRAAISNWQVAQNFPASGYLNDIQLETLKQQSEEQYQEWRKKARASRSRLPKGWWRQSDGKYCRRALLGTIWCQPNRP